MFKGDNARIFISAAAEGNIEYVKIMIGKHNYEPSFINAKNDQGDTALMVAVANMKHEVVKALLDCTAIDIHEKNNSGATAFFIAQRLVNINATAKKIFSLLEQAEADSRPRRIL